MSHEKSFIICSCSRSISNIFRKTTRPLPLKRIHLVWLSQDINEFSLFADTICNLTQMVCNILELSVKWMKLNFKLHNYLLSLTPRFEKFWNDLNQPDKFQVRFHLSSVWREQMTSIYYDGYSDEECPKTPQEIFGKNCDFVMSRMYWGRPKWHSLFTYWTKLYERETLNVFSRATKSINKEVRMSCETFNKNGFNFRFRHESFHWNQKELNFCIIKVMSTQWMLSDFHCWF